MSSPEQAEMYLSAYNNYVEANANVITANRNRDAARKTLNDAARLFLEITEEELTRMLYYWDSIATDAREVLGIKK